jgi:hypothetical protein
MPGTETAEAKALCDARDQIRRGREQLIHAGLSLRTEIKEAVDWRAWVRRAPVLWLGGAFVFGYFVGRRAPVSIARELRGLARAIARRP